jgi:hypothetical protein
MSARISLSSSSIARPSIDNWVPCRPLSSRSNMNSLAGSKRANCRHNSEPIEPPAPVTNTRRPVMYCATASGSMSAG